MELRTTGARIASLIESADHVLVGAGAGLTAAAGIDYGDEDDFARVFPVMHAEGFRNRLHMMGRPFPVDRFWAYWGTHVWDVLYRKRRFPLYERLVGLLENKDVFVHTSNVDDLFIRHGIDGSRVHTPQGRYANLQCRIPCSDQVWDSGPFVESIREGLDPARFVAHADAIPRCPNCGGPMFFNVRIDRSMVESPYRAQRARLTEWLQNASGSMTILEFGAGFNTPSVVRWPMEAVAERWSAQLVRINPHHPEVPDGGWSIAANADDVVSAWSEAA